MVWLDRQRAITRAILVATVLGMGLLLSGGLTSSALGPAPTQSAPTPTPKPRVFPALTNGGFEKGRPNGSPVAWRISDGAVTRSKAFKAEGTYSGAVVSETASTKALRQTVSVQAEKYYELTALALRNSSGVEEVYLGLVWYATPDGTGDPIGRAESIQRLRDNAGEFRSLSTGPVLAPEQAASAVVKLKVVTGSPEPLAVHFDSVAFAERAPVPPPTSSRFQAGEGQPSFDRPSPSPTPAPTPTPTPTPAATPTPDGGASNPPTAGGGDGGIGLGTALALIFGLALGLPVVAVSGWSAYGWWRSRSKGSASG